MNGSNGTGQTPRLGSERTSGCTLRTLWYSGLGIKDGNLSNASRDTQLIILIAKGCYLQAAVQKPNEATIPPEVQINSPTHNIIKDPDVHMEISQRHITRLLLYHCETIGADSTKRFCTHASQQTVSRLHSPIYPATQFELGCLRVKGCIIP